MINKTVHAAPSEDGAATLTLSMRVVESVILVLVLMLAIGFLWGTRAIRSFSQDAVGAHTFPEVLSVILIVICALGLFVSLRLPAEETIAFKRPRGLIISMFLLLAFPALVDALGYYVVIIPWLLIFGWAARVRTPVLIAITVITVVLVARVVFEMILGTPMP